MKKRVIISGLGAISAHGHNIKAICTRNGVQLPVEEHKFVTESLDLLPVHDLDISAVSGRLRKKLDPFAIFGLCASNMALKDSGLLDANIDLNRIGIFVGNCLGGWSFTEPELKKLHTIGVDAMSPYVATAWFPAALQGQISLHYGFKGYSKTYSASGVAGLQAISYAVEAIQRGRADVIVCGASEDLSSPYSQALLKAYDYGSEGRHSVFGLEKKVSFSEGAAFMVIESYEHAKKRGAPTYCEITGFAEHFCPHRADVETLNKRNLLAAITHADKKHLFVMDGLFADEADIVATVALQIDTPLVLVNSKQSFGNMFAVSGVMELACIAHDLRSGAARANRFGGEEATTDAFENVVVRRLSKHGGLSTLSVSTVRTSPTSNQKE